MVELTKEFLVDEYLLKKKSSCMIAGIVGCHASTVCKSLRALNLPIRTLSERNSLAMTAKRRKHQSIVLSGRKASEETKKKLSMMRIGRVVPNYVREKLKACSKYRQIFTKEFVVREYVNKHRTPDAIGKEFNCTGQTVRKYIQEHMIKLRGCSESAKLKPPMSKESRKKLSMAFKGRKHSEEHCRKVLQKVCASPNKFEFMVLQYLNEEYPGKFKYVGDGSVLINGRSPDFIDEEGKTVILANGVYWHLGFHGLPVNNKNKQIRERIEKEPFIKAGYIVRFIWEDAFKKGGIGCVVG